MGKITFGSKWDVENLRKIGVNIPSEYKILEKNPIITTVSTCDSASMAALRAAAGNYPVYTGISSDERGRQRCAAKRAEFIKKYPYYASMFRMNSQSGLEMPSTIEEIGNIVRSGGCRSTSRSSCGSCGSSKLIKTKKQKYNSKSPKKHNKRKHKTIKRRKRCK